MLYVLLAWILLAPVVGMLVGATIGLAEKPRPDAVQSSGNGCAPGAEQEQSPLANAA